MLHPWHLSFALYSSCRAAAKLDCPEKKPSTRIGCCLCSLDPKSWCTVLCIPDPKLQTEALDLSPVLSLAAVAAAYRPTCRSLVVVHCTARLRIPHVFVNACRGMFVFGACIHLGSKGVTIGRVDGLDHAAGGENGRYDQAVECAGRWRWCGAGFSEYPLLRGR